MSAKTFAFKCLFVAGLASPLAASAGKIDEFRQNFAKAVYQASPDWIHDRRPQPLLRAVVVLSIKLSEDNRWQTEIVRGNDTQPEMVARALAAVKRVRAATVPDELRGELMRNGFIETWLFDNDGSFQVRTLAKAQR